MSTTTTTQATVGNGDSIPAKQEQDKEEVDLRCGIKSCKPAWIQIFNNPKAFLAWLCCFSFVQGFVVNGINNVNTTTVERRFNLPSSQVGFISSAYDVSAGLLVIPITYFGNFGHQPRILACGAFSLSIGSLIMAVPHFATDKYEMGNNVAAECTVGGGNSTVEQCNNASSNLQLYLYVFILGQLLHGVGGTIIYSLGYVFIDGNVTTESSPLYQGIMNAFSALGPAAGFLAGGQFLDTLYVDFDQPGSNSLGITSSDPRWVGAWWVGFIISSASGFFVTFLFVGYARELPQAKAAREGKVSQAHKNAAENIVSNERFGRSYKDMPAAAKYILMNPTFVFVTLAGVTEGITLSGFATFISKFIQNQFGQTAGTAAILGGLVAVPGAAGGQLLGGVIARLGNLKVRGMLRLCIGLCLVCAVSCLALLINCGKLDIVGVTKPYINSSTILTNVNLTSTCNADCGCSTRSYEPICGADNLQYFTSCHAGCATSKLLEDGSKKYENCSCIELPPGSNSSAAAVAGPCDIDCNSLPMFLVGSFIVILLTLTAGVPALSTTLRCVPDSQRSFGIGIQWVAIRFLGTVPGPVIFGAVFDGVCTVWQENCGERGSCWIYENYLLSRNLAVFSACVKVLSAILFGIALYVYEKPEEMTTTQSTCQLDKSPIQEKTRNGVSGIDNQAIELSPYC